MFNWLRDNRRETLRELSFPMEWEAYIRANVAHYCVLDDAERAELRAMMQVFLVLWNTETYYQVLGDI